MLGNLMYQTRQPDEVLDLISDPLNLERLQEDFGNFVDDWITCENRNDHGHEKRALGLELASSEYVGFFNHDDHYELDYVWKMLSAACANDSDVVFCEWDGKQSTSECSFQGCSSTAGNFIVRADLAREVGWGTTGYEADARFINAVAGKTDKVFKVREVLYHHE